jgi:hypothetical protein
MTVLLHQSVGARAGRAWFVSIAACVAAWVLAPTTARASGHGSGHGAEEPAAHGDAPAAHGEAPAAAQPIDGVIDLGSFDLDNFRPTHNEVASIRFSLCLVLAPDVSDATVERLNHWRHRLRDQAIIAMRSAEVTDLADPSLERVQRLILVRIKRLPFTDLIEAAYLTDFAVGEEL